MTNSCTPCIHKNLMYDQLQNKGHGISGKLNTVLFGAPYAYSGAPYRLKSTGLQQPTAFKINTSVTVTQNG